MIDYVGQQLFTAAPEPAPSAWWASLMEAAAALEIAAMQIKDPDGKRQAQGACDFARSRAKQLWANSKPTACAAPSSEEVQWRNIKHVVRTLADWAFGGKDDPRWGTAWVAMVNGLTAKDGPTFNLERLAARVPYGCVVVGWLDGRGRFFYADDPMYKNNHKGMREVIAAGEVK